MRFAHPELLWGLWACAIPLIIHLLQLRRYRLVPFPHVGFLRQVTHETRSTQRLKHLLVLAMRILAIAALVAAFAQPYVPEAHSAGEAADSPDGASVSLYIDNSFSMEAEGEEGPLLLAAREKATAIVSAYRETDRFQVLTNDFSARDQTFLTRDQALERIAGILPGPAVRTTGDVVDRIRDVQGASTDRRRIAYLFTDLQQATHRWEDGWTPPDTSLACVFVPVAGSAAPNVWVDSVWFDEPMRIAGRAAELHVRLRHTATSGVEGLPLRLSIDGTQVAVGSFPLTPGAPTDTVLRFTHGAAGRHRAVVSIEDAPVRFDDAYHFGFEVVPSVRILSVSPAFRGGGSEVGRAVRAAFEAAGGLFELREVAQITPDDLAGTDLVVVHGLAEPTSGLTSALRDFAALGGSVAWCADPGEAAAAASALRAAWGLGTGTWIKRDDRAAALRTEHPFFRGVFQSLPQRMDLPRTGAVLDRRPSSTEEVLVSLESGAPWVTRLPVGAGSIYYLSADVSPTTSNLTRHALWVPLLYRMAERSRATPLLAGTIGDNAAWSLPFAGGDAGRVSLQLDGDSAVVYPEVRYAGGAMRMVPGAGLTTAGAWAVATDTSALGWIGANYDRMESDPAAYTPDAWRERLAELGWRGADVVEASPEAVAASVRSRERGTHWWKPLLVLALLALLVESLLLRPWKSS